MSKILIIFIFIFIFILILNLKNNEFFGLSKYKIPKIIIQTWKNDEIPGKYYNNIKSLMINNKDYNYIFFNDNDIENFLYKYYRQNYYETFNKLPYKIQKIDFFRYIAIYHYGGFYFDLDMTGLLSLDDLLLYDCVFPIDQHLFDKKCKEYRFDEFCNNKKININFLLGQYAFGATKNNDFIKYIIDGIHNDIDIYININNKYKDDPRFNYENYIYKTTGPDYVTSKYLEYTDKENIHILNYKKNQYFGIYAVHNYYGTWK